MTVLRRAASLSLGGLFALGQPPYDLWWVAVSALVAVFILVRADQSAASAAWTGGLFGVGYFALSLRWILEPFQVDAAATGWMAPFALVGLAAGLSVFWAAAFWVGRRISAAPFAIAVCWATAEFLRAYVLTGFPWGLLGYVWASTPIAQWHAVIGPHGLTFATLMVAALFAVGLTVRKWLIAVGLIAVVGAAGAFYLTPAPPDLEDRPVVRLIQPNAPQDQKWHPDHIPTFFARQVDFTAQMPPPDLIVWPETAVPNLLHNAVPAFEVIAEAAAGTPVVLGIQREEAGRYYNSLVTLNKDGQQDQLYDKHHLVPFGEYMPLASLFSRFNILGLAARADTGYSAGPGPMLIDLGVLGSALPLICYEAVFPQDVNASPSRPDVVLQITNDAWFGTYAGPQQHLQQARLRAIEQGLPVIRVANTGISAVIDPAGRVIDALPLGRAGFLDVPVPAGGDATLYSITRDWSAVAALIVAFAALIGRKYRRAH
ncbi:apolipoprotein N-acyltransferase [Marivita sp. S0852]|uniref:apolipoprotein N-acyltransferase n=1 Tax=Marivita sp. S0852 TaxID=3373893 RepID=UPI00398250C7